MGVVRVSLGDRSYDIDIAEGNLSKVGEMLAGLGAKGRVAIVTDSTVGPLYADTVVESVAGAGLACRVMTVPPGEASKCVGQLKFLWDSFVEFDMDRDSMVVALGGGVVGDLAGFAAATYMRGVRYVQVPTSMLAFVDSSVGGKTAIDLESGKNLVGAFHQPSMVIADPATLKTLRRRELSAGLAEVIKHGVIMDAEFFEQLEDGIEKLLDVDVDYMTDVIRRNCELKARVVAEDEREFGRRAILNYGHTVGHAFEILSVRDAVVHGEAVSVGMVVASRVAEKLGMIEADVTERQVALLKRVGLPTALSGVETGALIETMRHDKKARAGKLKMILPVQIGDVKIVSDVSPDVIADAVEDSRG